MYGEPPKYTKSVKQSGHKISRKITLQWSQNILTHSMEQSPSSEGTPFSASQEIYRILWKPKDHYRNHNSPPPVPTLSQINPFHPTTSHFLKIHFNIILPSAPGFPKWFLSLRSSSPQCCIHLSSPPYVLQPRPSHSSSFDHPKSIWWGVQIINPLTPELNSSAQRCLTRIFLLEILLHEPYIPIICARKTNKCNNYSFSLLITYSSSYMFRHYIAIFR
jgi:hypothetical protein